MLTHKPLLTTKYELTAQALFFVKKAYSENYFHLFQALISKEEACKIVWYFLRIVAEDVKKEKKKRTQHNDPTLTHIIFHF